jgi:hypothetical protein
MNGRYEGVVVKCLPRPMMILPETEPHDSGE